MTIEQITDLAKSGKTIEAEAQLIADFSISQTSAQKTVFKMMNNETVTGAELVRPLNPFDGQIFDDPVLEQPIVFSNGNWKNFAGILVDEVEQGGDV